MIEVRKVAGALGAEVLGVDLSRTLAAATVTSIRAAWLEHLVLFFAEQHLESAHFLRFAQTFGEPMQYPFLKGLSGFPEITEVRKLEHERANFGGIWHSDTTYLQRPPMASMLYAIDVPPFGGDTLFANQYLAFAALSSGMQRMLDGMVAVSSSAKAETAMTREDLMQTHAREEASTDYSAEHPVVRTHPETGRKSLYVNAAHTLRFRDMSEEESAPLLAYLFQHQIRPEFTCRFRWRVDSLALWDNRCALHNPVNDYHGQRRLMHRITLAGDEPR